MSAGPADGAPRAEACFHDARSAARFRDDKLGKTNLFESARMFCDVYALQPGQEQVPHAHADNDKLYSVLSGRCVVIVGAHERELGPGGVAIAPAGVPHGLRNASDGPTTLLVAMAPHPSPPSP